MTINGLTNEENDIIQLFFDLFPQWKDIVCQQICNSKIKRYNNISNNSTCFFPYGKVDSLNIKSKLPVEIILGDIQLPCDCVLNTGTHNVMSPCIFSTLGNDVIGLRLYFNNGIIEELEMYNIAGFEINLCMWKAKKRTYIVHENAGDCSMFSDKSPE